MTAEPLADGTPAVLPLRRTALLGALAFLGFLVFSGPVIPWRMKYFEVSWGWSDYGRKLNDPWLDLSKGTVTPDQHKHLQNLNYRLTAPVIAKVFRIKAYGYVFLSGLACFITCCAFVRFGWSVSGDSGVALGTGLLFAGLTAASQSVRSFTGHFDGLALCLLSLSMVARGGPAVAIAFFAALWADQRVLFVMPLVLLVHAMKPRDGEGSIRLDFRRPPCIGMATAFTAWVLTFALAVVLSRMRANPGGVAASPLRDTLACVPGVSWLALEGSWILVVAAVAAAWHAGSRFLAAAMACAVGAYLGLSFTVLDVTRSVGYLLPAIPLAVGILARGRSVAQLRRLVFTAAALSLVSPNYEVILKVHTKRIEPAWNEVLITFFDLWPRLPL